MGLKCDDDDDVAFPGGEVNCVHCSICLDAVADDGNRSWAKLQCGHKFHLDCIGSAFNAKGAMQCPNCRKIEKGQWLFPNGGRTFPDYGSMEEWTHEEDLYELGYPDMSFGAHWSPFGELANIPTPFEERGYSSASYQELLGQRAVFTEHTAISAHPCPYVAYLGPYPSPSSYINSRFPNGTNSSHWNGQSLRREMHEYVPFPAMDLHHHVWENPVHPPSMSGGRIGNAEAAPLDSFTQRSSSTNSYISRSGSSGHPYHIDSSSSRSGGSVSSALISPYPGSSTRSHDRVQALQAYYQQQTGHQLPTLAPLASTGNRQSSGSQRSISHSGMVASPHGLSGGFFFSPVGLPDEYVEDRESIPVGQFHSWERDHLPSSLLLSQPDQDTGWEHSRLANLVQEVGPRRSSFQRRGSERSLSYSRS